MKIPFKARFVFYKNDEAHEEDKEEYSYLHTLPISWNDPIGRVRDNFNLERCRLVEFYALGNQHLGKTYYMVDDDNEKIRDVVDRMIRRIDQLSVDDGVYYIFNPVFYFRYVEQ